MKTLVSIFKKPTYVVLGFFISLVSFIIFSITPHLEEIGGAIALDDSLQGGGSIMRESILTLLKHNTEPTLIPTLLIAVLTGVIISLLVFYYKQQGAVLVKTSGTGFLGLLLGLLGIGCSACGTLALTAVLGTVGLGGLVLLLPFRGAEFLYFGVIALLFSVWQLVRLINKPLTCE